MTSDGESSGSLTRPPPGPRGGPAGRPNPSGRTHARMRRHAHRKGTPMPQYPAPWGPTILPAYPEPMLTALWRRRHSISEPVAPPGAPDLPPAHTTPYYTPAAQVLETGILPINSSDPAGMGPNIQAAAMITVWQAWEYAYGSCHRCRGPMVATSWGGIVGVGGVLGVCVECFERGGRFLPGVGTAVLWVDRVLGSTPWKLSWTPLTFRLGGCGAGSLQSADRTWGSGARDRNAHALS